jgi:hypothetical protein
VAGGAAQTLVSTAQPERVPGAAEDLLDRERQGRDFLPLPLSSPMVVPQQEGPGVVVTAARADAGPAAPLGPGSVPSLPVSGAGEPLKLAHYAFGAYQRGLYNTAFDVALRAAAEDDPDAAALIGRLYEEAKGREQDFDKAAGWYAVAADLGHAGAQNRLGLMLLTGRGVPADPEKAADTFEKAAKAGSADAAHSLALMVLKGEGRPRDPQAAFRYMLQAAEGGDPAAQYAVAVMYEEGQGTVPDDGKATRWYGRAARGGHTSALLPYAMRLVDGVGVEADAATAARYFALAAREGNAVAMNRYAHLLANGRGVKADPVEAIKWHILARQAGVSDLFLDGFMGTADPEAVEEARRRAAAFASG